MGKIFIGLSSILFTITTGFGQHVFNPQNARDGETVEYCHENYRLEQMRLKDPVMYQQYIAGQQQLELETQNYVAPKSDIVYIIPIVFHVIHNGGQENISDEQIYDAVRILNRDFRRLNADADNVQPLFQGMPKDASIEFRLATIAPDGDCFKGITRTLTSLTNDGSDGQAQLNAAFFGNDVCQGTWSHTNYLNILVARNIGGAAGYTYRPSSWGGTSVYYNSIWMLQNYTGSIGTSSEGTSRTLTHEVGHWLNLKHTWGDGNSPGSASNCDMDDDVADTPNTVGSTYCNFNETTCGPVANVENYMDYSYCSKMYTPGQVDRMRAAVVSATGSRSNLWTEANLAAVGAIDNPPLCKADFFADKRVICAGESVQFSDDSYNDVSGWSWSFQGGTPASATTENPAVVYTTPGTYEVSLTASSGGDSESETKVAYITVLGPGTGLPFYEGFENFSTMADVQNTWFIDNGGSTNGFELTSSAANTGTKSLKINNFYQSGINKNELSSSNVDLSGEVLNDVTLSFRYAYRKRELTTQEYLKVYFSADCGESWGTPKKTLNANLMSNQVVTSPWTPTTADWKTVHIPFNNNSFTQFLVENFRYKFSFEANGGNNFYLDDINIYKGQESDDIVLGIEEKGMMNEITLFPNPNDGEMNVSFSLNNAQQVYLTVMDLSGKELKSAAIYGRAGENTIMMDHSGLASGVYFIRLNTESSDKILQFIKN